MAARSSTDFGGNANAYVDMGANSTLGGSTEMTVQWWMNYDVVENDVSFGSQWTGFPAQMWYTAIEGNNFRFQILKASGNYIAVKSTTAPATLFSSGTWYNVAWTWKYSAGDYTDFTLYIDGASESVSSLTGAGTADSIRSQSYNLDIGALGASVYNFDGKIAFYNLYSKELSVSEVQENMYNQANVFSNAVVQIPLYSTTAQDLIVGTTATTMGSDTSASTSGPPVGQFAAANQ